MRSTQNNSPKKNIDTFFINIDLGNSKKINHHVRSNDGESKSNSNISHAYKNSRSQNISFPEADHEKNRPSHTKRRWQKILIENETKKINRQKEFEKIDLYDSSDDFIGYSGSSETESYPNIKERNLSENKK